MKKKSFIKSLCLTIALSLLSAVLPMGVMASLPANKTITAEYDTFVRDYYKDTAYNEQDVFYVTVKSGNNKFGMIGFDLREIAPKDGYEIDTATLTVSLNGYKRAKNSTTIDTGAHSFSAYALGTFDYEATSALTYNNSYSNLTKKYISSTIVCPQNTYEQKDKYRFDVSAYFDGLTEFEDYQIFALRADALTAEEKALGINTVEASFFSLEKGWTNYRPTLTVSYKPSVQTIKAADTAFASQDSTSDNSLQEYSIQNIGSSKYNRAMYSKFDLSSLTIPEGAVISEATLRLYATKNNNKCPTAVRIYNIEDDSWTDESVVSNDNTSWENAPGSADILSGLGTAEGISSVATIPYEDSTTVNQWIEFDVTSYVSGQYHTDTSRLVSFAAYPDVYKNEGAVSVASDNYEGFEPELVIKFTEEEAVSIGTPTFSAGALATTTDTLVNGKQMFVKIPVFGASNTPLETNVFVVQYDASNDALVGIDILKGVDFYAGNGELTFGFYSEKYNKPCDMEVYVWSPDGLSYANAHIDMTAP